jgi:hypothetical protein
MFTGPQSTYESATQNNREGMAKHKSHLRKLQVSPDDTAEASRSNALVLEHLSFVKTIAASIR